MINIFVNGCFKSGSASFGFCVLKGGKTVLFGCGICDAVSSVTAEYVALINALYWVDFMGIKSEGTIYTDNMTVVNQLNDMVKCKRGLRRYCREARALVEKMDINVCWASKRSPLIRYVDSLGRRALGR